MIKCVSQEEIFFLSKEGSIFFFTIIKEQIVKIRKLYTILFTPGGQISTP